jgi:hypothetical protein
MVFVKDNGLVSGLTSADPTPHAPSQTCRPAIHPAYVRWYLRLTAPLVNECDRQNAAAELSALGLLGEGDPA